MNFCIKTFTRMTDVRFWNFIQNIMLCSRGLIFVIFFTLATANTQFISLPQPLQPNVLQGLNQLAAEQSRYALNAQLTEKATRKAVVEVKPIFVPIIVPEQTFQSLTATNQNQSPIPGSFPYNSVESLIYPALNAPHNNFPDYLSTLITNPSQVSPQRPEGLNVSDADLKELPQLLYDLKFYNSPLPRDDISNEKNDKNLGPLQGIQDIIEANKNLKPARIEFNPVAHNDEVLLTDDGVNKIIFTSTRPSTQSDTLLQELLRKLSSRKRIQERLGAVYLRESLLNRK